VQDEDDKKWIVLAQTGDRNAFAELAKRYWGQIFRWLVGREGCAHAAEDLTQEVFVKAWQGLPSFHEGNFRAWLFRIARNNLIDRLRGKHATPAETLPFGLSSNDPEPVDNVIAQELRISVVEACRKLPELLRSAFLLSVEEKMSYAEIALILEITEVTARWRVYKARRLLLQMLASPRGPKTP
jgi:RNA polymerase sigma-70 factor (ECF subfamily)